MAEGARLERVCALITYHGFESHLLRVFIPPVALESFIHQKRLKNSFDCAMWETQKECVRVKCPFCDSTDFKVTDSRNACELNAIRRRRECLQCGLRFTTFETVELSLQVRKRDGGWEDFDKQKLIRGIQAACHHTKVSRDQIGEMASGIMRDLMQRQNQQIEAMELGERVMHALQKLDRVAYIRYACVYRRFKQLDEVVEAIRSLEGKNREESEVGNGQSH